MQQPPFADSADFQECFGVTTTRTDMDLDAASAAIRGYCRWMIWPATTETLILDGPGTDVLMIPTMNLTAITQLIETPRGPSPTPVTLDITKLEWSAAGMVWRTDSVWGPYSAFGGFGGMWTSRARGISITITHGYDDVPAEIRRLTLDLARRSALNPMALSAQQVGLRSESYAGRGILLDEKAMLDTYRRLV